MRDSIARYITLSPVIDGVEGTYAKAPRLRSQPGEICWHVPAQPPAGGTLRHKGWRAAKVDFARAVRQTGRHCDRSSGNRN